jgi:hypothetical protein
VSAQLTLHAASHQAEQRVQLAVAGRGELVEHDLAAVRCGKYADHRVHGAWNRILGGHDGGISFGTIGVHASLAL